LFRFMALRTCKLSCRDPQGVEHRVGVSAQSVFEGVAQALCVFRESEWCDLALAASVLVRMNSPRSSIVYIRDSTTGLINDNLKSWVNAWAKIIDVKQLRGESKQSAARHCRKSGSGQRRKEQQLCDAGSKLIPSGSRSGIQPDAPKRIVKTKSTPANPASTPRRQVTLWLSLRTDTARGPSVISAPRRTRFRMAGQHGALKYPEKSRRSGEDEAQRFPRSKMSHTCGG